MVMTQLKGATWQNNVPKNNNSNNGLVAEVGATFLSNESQHTLASSRNIAAPSGNTSDQSKLTTSGNVWNNLTEQISHLKHKQQVLLTSSEANLEQTMSNTADERSDKLASDANLLEMPELNSFAGVFSFSCSTAVIFGGLIPYIPQYLKIRQSSSSEGFSTYVCLTLLIANILRVLFWFGHRFELPLLIQSLVMIVGMLAMMEICVRVKSENSAYMISSIGVRQSSAAASSRRSRFFGKLLRHCSAASHENEVAPIYSVSTQSPGPSSMSRPADGQLASHHSPTSNGLQNSTESHLSDIVGYNSAPPHSLIADSSVPANFYYSSGFTSRKPQRVTLLRRTIDKCLTSRNFWNWNEFSSYIKFLFVFTAISALITYLLINDRLYIETLGFVALLSESMLGLPQLMRNFTKKSTRGMSVEMVVMWLAGDLFKTLYFTLRHAPAQFIVCGSIQVSVDILIIIQVFWYRQPVVAYRKLPRM